MSSREKFEGELLKRSLANDIETATLEWRTLHHQKHETPQFCICGHHVKHVIPIFNIHTHQLFNIGNTCASKHNIKTHLSNETLFMFLNSLIDDPTTIETKLVDIRVHLSEFIREHHLHLKKLMTESDDINYFDIVLPLCKLNENVDELIHKFHFDLVELHNLIINDVYFMNEKIKKAEKAAQSNKKKPKRKRHHKKKKNDISLENLNIERVVDTSNNVETFFESPTPSTGYDVSENLIDTDFEEFEGSQIVENETSLETTQEYLGDIENQEIEGSQMLECESLEILECETSLETTQEYLEESILENNTTEYLEEIENQEFEGSQMLECESLKIVECETSLETTQEYLEEIENQEFEGSQMLENETPSKTTYEYLEESIIKFLTTDSSEVNETSLETTQEYLGESILENNTTEYLGEFENQEIETFGRSENETSLEVDYYVYQTEIGKGIGYRLERLRQNIRSLRIEVREFSELIQKTNYESKKRIDEMRLKYSSYRSRKR